MKRMLGKVPRKGESCLTVWHLSWSSLGFQYICLLQKVSGVKRLPDLENCYPRAVCAGGDAGRKG